MSTEKVTDVLKKSIDDQIIKLMEALKQGQSEHFKNYLKVVSRFHKYSLNNQFLICIQNPEAKRVAGYETWKQLGRQVKKGEKSIKILAPCTGRKKVTNKEGNEEEKKYIWFKVVSVFDISQTEGEDLPTMSTDNGEDLQNIYGRLKVAMEKRGNSVTEKSIFGGALGLAYPDGSIEIEENQDQNNKASTLIHEVAHVLLKHGEKKDLSQGFKECQEEAATFVVLSHFGESSELSRDYLLNWGNTEEELRTNLTEVLSVSKEIIEILESRTNSEVSSEASKEEIAA